MGANGLFVLHFGASFDEATVAAQPTELTFESLTRLCPIPTLTDVQSSLQELSLGWGHVLTIHDGDIFGR